MNLPRVDRPLLFRNNSITEDGQRYANPRIGSGYWDGPHGPGGSLDKQKSFNSLIEELPDA